MKKYISLEKISNKSFRMLCGVTRETLEKLEEKCQKGWEQIKDKKKLQGRPHEIGGLKEHLIMMLILYRCHITQEFMGVLCRADRSTVCRSLKRIEAVALKVLKIQKNIKVSKKEAEALLIDCTEQQILRPEKNQEPYYSGKKKKHTIKAEIIVTGKNKIVGVSESYAGSVHDLTVRRSEQKLPKGSHMYADTAYQGYEKETEGVLVDYPYKKPKGGELTIEEKEYNQGISRFRVKVEHKIGDIKTFRKMADRYRYPLEKHNYKLHIVCGLVNMNHGF
jgi:DDE superfamily endonuclease